MKPNFKSAALVIGSVLFAISFGLPAVAADAPAPAARATFDGNIKNNSLALSPDESTAVVSYSERPDVVVYNLQKGTERGVLQRLRDAAQYRIRARWQVVLRFRQQSWRSRENR